MNKIYYPVLLAGAASVFLITPAVSEESKPLGTEPALVAEAASNMQNRDTSTADSMEKPQPQTTQVEQEPGINETISAELYSKRPNDLLQKEVRNSNEETVGKVSAIVSSRQDGQIHVVISSGGFFGIGASEYVVPLHGLSMNDEKLYLRSATGKDLLRKEYLKDGYVMIKPKDRPISEFSAFEERKQ